MVEKKFKVHILYDFREGPWGGGNQFLKALRNEWCRNDQYAQTVDEADAVLVNAFPTGHSEYFMQAVEYKCSRKKSVFYRLDGLYHKNRLDDDQRRLDDICTYFANNFTDGVIFQTFWVKKMQQSYGINSGLASIVCFNAPDSELFTRCNISFPSGNSRIRLVSTCWSANKRKGFEWYRYLDRNLDFSKYEMTFIGNSPVVFDNIKMIEPLSTVDLVSALSEYHAFVSCAFDEPCSNSLIEAMSLGLPALGHNSGGTVEIIGKGGVLFDNEVDILEKLDILAGDLQKFADGIDLPDMSQVAHKYYSFMRDISLKERHEGDPFACHEFDLMLRRCPEFKKYYDNKRGMSC